VLEHIAASAVNTVMQPHSSYVAAVGACAIPPGHCGAAPVGVKPPSQNEQIVEPLFGVDLVERIGTNTRLSRTGAGDGRLQVPGSAATEWEPVVVVEVPSCIGGPPVSPSS